MRRRATSVAFAGALLPASAYASDMSGMATIMMGLPAMLVAALALGLIAARRRPGTAAVGTAVALFIAAALVLFFLLRDSLALFPNYAIFSLAFYAGFGVAAMSFVKILRKREAQESENDGEAP